MNKKIIEPRILKGFRDFLPEDEINKRETETVLENVFRDYGFVPIDTPVLEYTEVLLGKGGGETDKQVYRFTDNGGRDVSMRFDLTVPFARYMAAHRHDLYLPFKRYHISKVWRGENTQRGRYREFTQCDFDIVGVDSASSDFEILLLMKRSLESLGIPQFTIHLSNRQIFNQFLQNNGLLDSSAEILRIVDKLKKIGKPEVLSLLGEITTGENSEKILDFIKTEENNGETLRKLTEYAGIGCPGVINLQEILGYIRHLDIEEYYTLDPSITRGLDYYTGIVFETFLTELPDIGSVCSGGRYNNLASLYTQEELPGVGASIGLDRLTAALEQLGRQSEKKSTIDLLVFCLDEKLFGHYHLLAETYRENGISCEVFPEKKKLGQQFQFAGKKDIQIGVICGEDEYSGNSVNVKNLNTRESFEKLSLEDSVSKILELKAQ